MGTIPAPQHLTDTSSSRDTARDMVTSPDPLYVAVSDYEDAANQVGVLAIQVQAAYRTLSDALMGYGDLEEARTSFAVEHVHLHDANIEWSQAAFRLRLELSRASIRHYGQGPRTEPFDYRAMRDVPLDVIAKGTTGFGDDF